MLNSHWYCINWETVPVPIIDQNTQTQSYTHLQVHKPYIALNSETCISIMTARSKNLQKNWLWILLWGTLHSKTQVQIQLWKHDIFQFRHADTIKENYKFKFYYNKTDITPIILDGGNEIILANWPNDKHIIPNIHNDIAVKIPSHSYVLVNRSLLCNCGIEADTHFLLKSLAACENTNLKLTMYSTVNTAFVNYPDEFQNLTESLEFPVVKERTTFEQTLPHFIEYFYNIIQLYWLHQVI